MISAVSKFSTTTASIVSSEVGGGTASHAVFCVISFTFAPSPQRSYNAGSTGSDMLLAVQRAKSSVTSSNRCRLRTGVGSEVEPEGGARSD